MKINLPTRDQPGWQLSSIVRATGVCEDEISTIPFRHEIKSNCDSIAIVVSLFPRMLFALPVIIEFPLFVISRVMFSVKNTQSVETSIFNSFKCNSQETTIFTSITLQLLSFIFYIYLKRLIILLFSIFISDKFCP